MSNLNENAPSVRPEVRLAQTPEERQRIYRFRYSVYVEEMGKRPGYADHEHKMLVDDLDETGHLLYVAVADRVIATVRINIASEAPFGEPWNHIYQMQRWQEWPDSVLSMSSRLMVDLEWRGSAVLGQLLLAIYDFARRRDIQFDFCNCSPSLVEFYEQLGYRRFGEGFMDEDAGYHVPLVIAPEDLAHLKKVRSPFMRPARKLPASDAATRWFEGHFPEHATHVNRRLVDSEQFWSFMEGRLHQDPRKSLSLLQGLTEEQAHQFLDTGTVLPCKAGDVVIRPGDVGDEMFLVLEGVAEVWSGDEKLSLAVLGPGQVFGEMAFVSHEPRTAKVVAKTDMQLLILTQGFFKRATKKMPDIVAQVLLNLSVVLVERLRSSTEQWVAKATATDAMNNNEDETVE